MSGKIHPSCTSSFSLLQRLRNPSKHQSRQSLLLILNWCHRMYPKAMNAAPQWHVPVIEIQSLWQKANLCFISNHDITVWCSAWCSTCHAAWSHVDGLRIRVHLETKIRFIQYGRGIIFNVVHIMLFLKKQNKTKPYFMYIYNYTYLTVYWRWSKAEFLHIRH